MRPTPIAMLLTVAVAISISRALSVVPEVAELSFDSRLAASGGLNAAQAPAWITEVSQTGGTFVENPGGWAVNASARKGVGRLIIGIDRRKMAANLVATVLFDGDDATDLAVQLFDAKGRVVVVDLFGNLVDVGKDLATNTVVIPLRKYPSAVKIVLRRIHGPVNVRGMVLYPVAMEGQAVEAEIRKLAATLGDPLSPENPLAKSLQSVAKNANATIYPIAPTIVPTQPPHPQAEEAPVENSQYYPAARVAFSSDTPPPEDGLVAHWNFDGLNAAADSGPLKLNGHGKFGTAPGVRGKALHLNLDREESVSVAHSAALELKDTLTVTAWIKYSRIAPNWGSQIVWFGDLHLGDDPWEIHLEEDGTLEFRSDRSITGEPIFTVFEDEIRLDPHGKEVLDQHVSVESPKQLAPATWYFVAGTMEKISPHVRSMKLYVNGERVGETRTNETIEYDTSKMWLEIGGVDHGDWQNFDGAIDEVRVYNRALSEAEISTLYKGVR